MAQGRSWLADRPADIPEADRGFISRSRRAARRRSLWRQAFIALAIVVVLPLLSFMAFAIYHITGMFWDISKSALTAGAEQALMSISSIVDFSNRQHMLKSPGLIAEKLNTLNGLLRDDERFKPAEFEAQLKQLRAILERA